MLCMIHPLDQASNQIFLPRIIRIHLNMPKAYGKPKASPLTSALPLMDASGEDLLRQAFIRPEEIDAFSLWPDANAGPEDAEDDEDDTAPQDPRAPNTISDPDFPPAAESLAALSVSEVRAEDATAAPHSTQPEPDHAFETEVDSSEAGDNTKLAQSASGDHMDLNDELAQPMATAETGCGEDDENDDRDEDEQGDVLQNQEGIEELVNEYLDELGDDILALTVKKIMAKMETSIGFDVGVWKSEIKALIKARAELVMAKQSTQTTQAQSGEGPSEAIEEPRDETENDAGDDFKDEAQDVSEYEASDDDDDDNAGKAKGAKSRLKQKVSAKAKKDSKVAQEELEALAEDEELRVKQAELMSMLNGDTAKRQFETQRKRAMLLERIEAKRQSAKAKYVLAVENKLKANAETPKAALSPDCVAYMQVRPTPSQCRQSVYSAHVPDRSLNATPFPFVAFVSSRRHPCGRRRIRSGASKTHPRTSGAHSCGTRSKRRRGTKPWRSGLTISSLTANGFRRRSISRLFGRATWKK